MPHPAFRTYRDRLNEHLATGQAGERAYYPAFEALLRALSPAVLPQCEPHGEEAGIPDFKLTLAGAPVGYVECKDLGVSLGAVARTDQFRRYSRYPSLLLTDFLEFRWYVDGQLRDQATLGRVGEDRRVHLTASGEQQTEALLRRFLEFRLPFPATAADLAARLARFAQELHDEARASFAEPDPPLEPLRQAFEQTLLPGLDPEQFADMYAQTLAYGLFSACFELRRDQPGVAFTRENAFSHLPPTNPFLRDLFYHIMGPGMPSRVRWVVDEIVDTLQRTEMGQIAADFAHREGREDPVVHFYETFLREYDPKKREVRGVYYTPEPVVSYIVRSIDWLLREKFNKPLGLADPDVYILDPACGTGTFLFYVIRQIHDTLRERGQLGAWNAYVRERLLPRLFGFELLMAPYTIAHMKLAIQLRDLGYDFSGDERLGIYLTNTLEEAKDIAAQFPTMREIVEEANAAADIKRDKPIMVILGNPPYSGHSANASWREVTDPVTGKTRREATWIGNLIRDYYFVDGQPLGERNPKWLQDDYVKFLRFAQWRIEQTGHGIVGMITNHGYLDNPTFRGMRQSLLRTFDQVWVLDLHGNAKKKEVAPDGSKDENVFDIQQGVAIGVFARGQDRPAETEVRHAELWGPEKGKSDVLFAGGIERMAWRKPCASAPQYLLRPLDDALRAEYETGWALPAVFPLNSLGIATARDLLTTDFTTEELMARVRNFANLEAEAAREKYHLGADVRDWKVDLAQTDVRASGPAPANIRPLLYRPFDRRAIYYTGRTRGFICMPREKTMRHMLTGPNLGLSTTRSIEIPRGFEHAFCTDTLLQLHSVSLKEVNYLFPLYLYPSSDSLESSETRRPNLNPAFIADLEQRLGLRFLPDGQGDLGQPSDLPNPPLPQGEGGRGVRRGTFGPEDVFYYAYAVFHSPTYRQRYAEFLKIDFPRLPLTSDRALFAALVGLGKRLVDLHLMRADGQIGSPPAFPISGDNIVERVRYVESPPGAEPPLPGGRVQAPALQPESETRPSASQPPSPAGRGGQGSEAPPGRVYINKTQYFAGVEPEVWNFHIGGYQVCEKWLKDRKGRALSWEDICHYQRIVLALRETREIMQRIDETIPAWPLE